MTSSKVIWKKPKKKERMVFFVFYSCVAKSLMLTFIRCTKVRKRFNFWGAESMKAYFPEPTVLIAKKVTNSTFQVFHFTDCSTFSYSAFNHGGLYNNVEEKKKQQLTSNIHFQVQESRFSMQSSQTSFFRKQLTVSSRRLQKTR